MATSWKSQQVNGKYFLQFETDDKEKYKIVEKASQMAIDVKTTADDVPKSKIAKEIFELIRNNSSSIVAVNDYGELYHTKVYQISAMKLDELKKKYTEEAE